MILRMIHLLAAMVWAGGMIFFTLVVMPAVRQGLPPPQRQELTRMVGRRYRRVGWVSIVILLLTGVFLVRRQGVVWDSEFGRVLSVKLVLVGVMLILTVVHDLVIGPKAAPAGASSSEISRKALLYLARLNLLVVVAIVLFGVWLTAV